MNPSGRDLQGSAIATAPAAPAAVAEVVPGGSDLFPSPAQAWYAVFVLALVQMVNFLNRGILALLVEPIKHDLHLTDTQMSYLMGFAFVCFYMFLALPIARLADYKSRRVIIGVGIAAYSVTTACCGLARSFAQLFLCRIGVGVGAACASPASFSMLADLFPREKLARAFAVLGFGASAGSGLSLIIGGTVASMFLHIPPKTLPIVGTVHGWQLTLFAVGLPGLLVAALMGSVAEPKRLGRTLRSAAGSPAGRKPVPVREILAFVRENAAVFVPLLAGMGLTMVIASGSRGWGAAFYVRSFHWSPAKYGLIHGLLALTIMPVGSLAGGLLAERWAKRGRDDANLRVTVIGVIVSLPPHILFPLMPTAALAVAVYSFGSFFAGWLGAPMNAALQVITPNQMRGQITALSLLMFNVIGAGLGPTVVALLTDFVFRSEKLLGHSMAAGGLVLGTAGAIILCFSVKPYGRAVAKIKALS